LLARPAWRKTDSPNLITRSCNFTRGLEKLAAREPDTVTLHDTTSGTPAESAATIAAWVRRTAGSRIPVIAPPCAAGTRTAGDAPSSLQL